MRHLVDLWVAVHEFHELLRRLTVGGLRLGQRHVPQRHRCPAFVIVGCLVSVDHECDLGGVVGRLDRNALAAPHADLLDKLTRLPNRPRPHVLPTIASCPHLLCAWGGPAPVGVGGCGDARVFVEVDVEPEGHRVEGAVLLDLQLHVADGALRLLQKTHTTEVKVEEQPRFGQRLEGCMVPPVAEVHSRVLALHIAVRPPGTDVQPLVLSRTHLPAHTIHTGAAGHRDGIPSQKGGPCLVPEG
mmetsp:Transcript_20224/g.49103  ORF Transcript_20224/g.49103 Transcript_20224/m.49103 type:complete len:243 (+) Transcript_20224:740-1468(+)